MGLLTVIGAAVLAVVLLVVLGVGLMLLGGGTLTVTWTQQYGDKLMVVRKRFGRETGWRWVEDLHPTR